MHKDTREENIVEVAMEMERCEMEVVAKTRRAISDKVTLLKKSIKILDPR
jgi:hypothetical protein